MKTRTNIDERTFRAMSYGLPRRDRRWQVRRVAFVIAIFSFWTAGLASGGQHAENVPTSLQVPQNDLANAEALASQLAALSPRVDRKEAKVLADCAYATVNQLRRQYRMFGTPIFNNFLVYHGIKKRGYCYQWSEDLLIALNKLKLSSLDLHWGEAHAGSWRENNCLVVTAKGQPFRTGIMLDCWRHLGHLYFGPVVAAATNNFDPYVENRAYARSILARSAAPNASGVNHRVAFQRRTEASGKTGE